MDFLNKIKLPIQIQNQLPTLLKLIKGKTPAVSNLPVTSLACDYGKSKIVFAEIDKTPGSISLVRFCKGARGTGKDVDALKETYSKGNFSTTKVRISIKGQGVIIRFVQFPQMKPADLRSAISFEIDQYIPFKAHEVVWDFYILEENIPLTSGTGMSVLLVAVKREDLYSLIQTFQAADLQIELIDVDALASANALEYFHPEDFKLPIAILDIGTEVSTLAVIHNSKPRFIRDVTFGGVDVLKRLRRKLGMTQEQGQQQIEVDQVPTPEAAEVIKEALGDLTSDLRVSLNYYLDQINGAEPVKKLFVQGGGGYHPLIQDVLQKDLGLPVEVMTLTDKIKIAEGIDQASIKKNQGILPVALGLCLRDL